MPACSKSSRQALRRSNGANASLNIIVYLSTIVNRLTIIYNNTGVKIMISYEPFFKTLKEKELTTYKLINTYGISSSLIDRLKHNKPITTVTINDLCKILDCGVDGILEHQKSE